jgi:hypothetical protein
MRKFGAIDSSSRGVSSITPVGLSFLDLNPDSGTTALKKADSEVANWLAWLRLPESQTPTISMSPTKTERIGRRLF